MPLKNKFNTIKPWERLGISRKQYAASRPWKKAQMDKKLFETLICELSDEAMQSLRLEAEADALTELLFKSGQ